MGELIAEEKNARTRIFVVVLTIIYNMAVVHNLLYVRTSTNLSHYKFTYLYASEHVQSSSTVPLDLPKRSPTNLRIDDQT